GPPPGAAAPWAGLPRDDGRRPLPPDATRARDPVNHRHAPGHPVDREVSSGSARLAHRSRRNPGWGRGGAGGSSAAEAALAGRVGAQRPQEVDPAEVGPVGLAEVELAVHALPEPEATE